MPDVYDFSMPGENVCFRRADARSQEVCPLGPPFFPNGLCDLCTPAASLAPPPSSRRCYPGPPRSDVQFNNMGQDSIEPTPRSCHSLDSRSLVQYLFELARAQRSKLRNCWAVPRVLPLGLYCDPLLVLTSTRDAVFNDWAATQPRDQIFRAHLMI